jgi:hypothetical protein
VSLEVYDAIGRKVFQKKQNFDAGRHEIELNTEGVLQRGVYIYGIRTLNSFMTKRFIKF